MERRKFIQASSFLTLGYGSGMQYFKPLDEEILIRRLLFRLGKALLFDWATDSLYDSYSSRKKQKSQPKQIQKSVKQTHNELERQQYYIRREKNYYGCHYSKNDRDFLYPYFHRKERFNFRVPFFSNKPKFYGCSAILYSPEVAGLTHFSEKLYGDFASNIIKSAFLPKMVNKRKYKRRNEKKGYSVLYVTDFGEVVVSYNTNKATTYRVQFDYMPTEVVRSSANLKFKPLSEVFAVNPYNW